MLTMDTKQVFTKQQACGPNVIESFTDNKRNATQKLNPVFERVEKHGLYE